MLTPEAWIIDALHIYRSACDYGGPIRAPRLHPVELAGSMPRTRPHHRLFSASGIQMSSLSTAAVCRVAAQARRRVRVAPAAIVVTSSQPAATSPYASHACRPCPTNAPLLAEVDERQQQVERVDERRTKMLRDLRVPVAAGSTFSGQG
jgi:hypothetical protein